MPSNPSFSQKDLAAMLETAGKKLGVRPEMLRAALSDPKKAEEVLTQINQNSGGKIDTTSPETLERMVRANPAAKKALDDLRRFQK